MTSEIISTYAWLWSLAWQSTACLALGLGGSFIMSKHPTRAHRVLLLALIAAVVVPVLSHAVKQQQWGLLTAKPLAIENKRATAPPVEAPSLTAPRTEREVVYSDAPAARTATSVAAPTARRQFDPGVLLVPLWLLAGAALLARLLRRLVLGYRLVRHSEPVASSDIINAIQIAKAKLHVPADIQVRSHAGVRSPVIWCWSGRPVLLVPKAEHDGDPIDWPAVVCHELAHWKRRDHLTSLLAELLACVLPWQVLIWLAKRRLTTISEQACDDWVIASGLIATRYARTLLGLIPQGDAALAPAVVSSKKGLAGRICRIVEHKCANPTGGRRWTLAAASLAAIVATGIAFAQTRPAPQSPPALNAQPQASLAEAAGQATVDEEVISLRLVDQNGQPVAGARAASYVQVRETSVLGSRLVWSNSGVSDEAGQVTLEAEDVRWNRQGKATLYILHETRGIGALHEIASADAKEDLPVILRPVCHVYGTLDSAGLAAIGMPLLGASMQVRSDDFALQYSFPKRGFAFSLLLPAGTYTLQFGRGLGGVEAEGPIRAATESKALSVTVAEGQADLDLGVVDLSPARLSTLIGHPAPELGPIQAWKNGSPTTLAQLRGQFVWLHFGGVYPSVSAWLPRLVELHEAFSKDLTIIAIYNCTSMSELEQRWAEANERFGGVQNVPFRIAIDGGEPTFYAETDRERPGATYGRYDIRAYPTDVLIDPAGRVIGQPHTVLAKEIISQMLGTPLAEPLPEWEQRFNEVYRLEDDEIIRRIAPPFIPERMEYYRSRHEYQAQAIPRGPDCMCFHWDGTLRSGGMVFGRPMSLGSVLGIVLRLKQFEYGGPKELLDLELVGDWIVRDELAQEVKLDALEELIARELGRHIRFEKRTVDREVIVASGQFRFHPPTETYESTSIHLYADETDPDEGSGGGTADSLSEFLQRVGDRVNMPVIDRTEPGEDMRVPYRHHRSSRVHREGDAQEQARKLRILLDHLTEQTELQFEVATRPVEVWFVVEGTTN